MKRHERIELAKERIGTKSHRKRQRHSDKFNRMFRFYYLLSRSGLVTFCGSEVKVEYRKGSSDAKVAFKEYDNGLYKSMGVPVTCHPNVLCHVLTGKKGWGLWCDQWAQGIGQGLFTRFEIYEMFREHGIELPESIEREFDNLIWEYRFKNPGSDEYRKSLYLYNK